MILLIDIGNTNIVLGISDGKNIIETHRYLTQSNKTEDEYYSTMKDMLNGYEYEGAIISSVVPAVTNSINLMISKHLKINAIIVGIGVKSGLEIKTSNLKEVGSDLVCDCVAALSKYKGSCLIIDLGTANKYLYAKDNIFYGAIFSPGVHTSLKALVDNTALLPHIEIKAPKHILGNNTVECLQSGVTYGVASQIDGLVKRIKEEVNEPLNLIATGGLSKLIIPLCDNSFNMEPNLVLEGLLIIYNKNK